MTRRCLIIVAKDPLSGQAKTRLARGIGDQQARALYRCFLYDTVELAQRFAATTLAFSFWPATSAASFGALANAALLLPQHGADFGSRLLSAFEQAHSQGYDQIVLIGSDNPSLPPQYVEQAFAALATSPTVLGPANDGGYYLIGMHAPQPGLFHPGIAWSTASVAQQTRAAAAEAGLAMAQVPPWYDIDTADDLHQLYTDLAENRLGCAAPRTLAALAGLLPLAADAHHVVR